MKRNKVFSTVVLFCLLVLEISSQADAATDTVRVKYSNSGISPSSFNVKVGDVIIFGVDNIEPCADQIYLFFTSVPPGAPNPLPIGTGYARDINIPGPFIYTVSVSGKYLFKIGSDTGNFIASAPTPTYHTVLCTSTGLSPSSLDVKVGDVIGLTGIRDGEFYGVTMTSAPAGSGISVGTESQMLAGCLDFGFTANAEGTYCFTVVYDAGIYTGSITADAPAAASVQTNGQSLGFSMTVNHDPLGPINGAAMINISADKPCDLHLTLFDASGRLIHQYEDIKLGSGNYSLPLTSFVIPNGEYYLRAIDGGETVAVTKVLIVH